MFKKLLVLAVVLLLGIPVAFAQEPTDGKLILSIEDEMTVGETYEATCVYRWPVGKSDAEIAGWGWGIGGWGSSWPTTEATRLFEENGPSIIHFTVTPDTPGEGYITCLLFIRVDGVIYNLSKQATVQIVP